MKKTKQAAALSIAEQATQRAERIKGLATQIENLQDELALLKMEQIEYMEANLLKSDNGFMLVETAGRSKLGGLTGKALTTAKERLLAMIEAAYVKKTLDEAKITASVQSDDALFGQLTKVGLKVETSEPTYSLRTAKDEWWVMGDEWFDKLPITYHPLPIENDGVHQVSGLDQTPWYRGINAGSTPATVSKICC